MAAAKLKVGLYARVSTTKVGQVESPEGQFVALRAYFARREDCIVVKERFDRVSGAKGERDRPALAELMADARAGKLDAIAVTRLDRLFRSLPRWLETSQELQSIGVALIYSDYPQLDPTTPMGRLMVYVLAALAEFFRDVYGSAAVEGKARALAAGKHCARPREVVQVEALRMVDQWERAFVGSDARRRAGGWRGHSYRLAKAGWIQQGRVILTTGRVRESRPWPPGTLQRAYLGWVKAGRPSG